MWTIAELGLAHERVDAGHRFGKVDTPEFRAMNPNGLVPVLIDGDGEPLWESAAIVRYLASRYAGAPFWPEDLAARAQVDKWAEWAKLNVVATFSGSIFWPIVRMPASARNPEAIKQALRILDGYLDIAERQLALNPYVIGQSLSVADIQFGQFLYRYFEIDIERRPREILQAYYRRLTARPAYREHVMVSFEDLRAPA